MAVTVDEGVEIRRSEANSTADLDCSQPTFLPEASDVALGSAEVARSFSRCQECRSFGIDRDLGGGHSSPLSRRTIPLYMRATEVRDIGQLDGPIYVLTMRFTSTSRFLGREITTLDPVHWQIFQS